MSTPTTSPQPQLSLHRRLPHDRHSEAQSARLEFTRRLSEAVARARSENKSSQALLTIDLDGFTRIRASFGGAAAKPATRRRRKPAAGLPRPARSDGAGRRRRVSRTGRLRRQRQRRLADRGADAGRPHGTLCSRGPSGRDYSLRRKSPSSNSDHGLGVPTSFADAFAALHRSKVAWCRALRSSSTVGMPRSVRFEQLRLAAELRNAIRRVTSSACTTSPS
jgi:hypothetical protein